MLDKVWEELLQNLGTIIGYVGVGLTVIGAAKAKEWFEARKARRSTLQSINNSVILNSFLGEIRILSDVDRIAVCQFHNGEHFASGASVQKVTLTHCSLRTGVSLPSTSGLGALQGTPSSFMTGMLDKVFQNGYVVYPEYEADDYWIARYHAINGLRTVVVCLIPGRHPKEALGILTFNWIEQTPVTKEMIDQFMIYAKRTSVFL